MDKHLFVGLGNPGPQYAGNRHNVGFMVIDAFAQRWGCQLNQKKFNGLCGTAQCHNTPVVCLKPQTFMNVSGRSVAPAQRFFGLESARLLVVHDELDLPFGRIRLKCDGGHGGHNGLRSIMAETGSKSFMRLRMGIGRPPGGSVSNFVLSNFAQGEEIDWLPDLIDRAVSALEQVLSDGLASAMTRVNAT